MATAATALERTRPIAWQLGAAIICLIALQGWVTLTHDAWLDEWQAMLLAMQSPDLATLSANLRYEGHPPLWYLILKIAGSVATPEWAMRGTAFLIAASTIMIVMLRAPFALWERIAICCGYFMLVEYGSLSRGVGLGVMLMFLFVATQNKWLRWGILILFPMIEVQFAVLAVMGAGMMIRDRQWSWAAAVALIVSMAAMVWLVWPAPDMHTAVNLKPTFAVRLAIFLLMFGNMLVPMPLMDGEIYWFGNAPGLAGIIFAGLFLWLGIHTLRRDRWHLLAFAGFFAFTLFMAMFVYQLSLRHAGLIVILLLVLAWRSVEAGTRLSHGFRAWLMIGAACGLVIAVHINRVGFDSSGKAARFIQQQGLADKLLVSFEDPHAVPVTARLGVPNYNMTKQCAQTFIRWDRKAREWTIPTLETAITRTARDYGTYYIISNIQFDAEPETRSVARLLTPVAAIAPGYTSGGYYIYRAGAGSTGKKPATCAPLDTKTS